MTAYYNEHDPYAAQWLRNLINAKLIPAGDVDERSIVDVRPDDLIGYIQCHFFAGIAGWPYALRIAGWPDSKPVWTGSCPCPPWSRARIWHKATAGKLDSRDLWPDFFRLIDAGRPGKLYGEQVAGSKVGPWIERAQADLEQVGYRFAGRTERARDHGGPQGRERFFFSADLGSARGKGLVTRGSSGASRPWRWGGQEDLRAIAAAPFEPGRSWPQPLIRRSDDGFPPRVAALRAYGNAIDPWVAAQVISDMEIAA